MRVMQSRRGFVASVSTAGAAALVGSTPCLADEGPPETTTVRLPKTTNICFAPLLLVEELLRAEGFTEIRFVPTAGGFTFPGLVARGEIDFGASFAGAVVFHVSANAANGNESAEGDFVYTASVESAPLAPLAASGHSGRRLPAGLSGPRPGVWRWR